MSVVRPGPDSTWVVYLTAQERWALRQWDEDGNVVDRWGRAEILPLTWAVRTRIPLFRPQP